MSGEKNNLGRKPFFKSGVGSSDNGKIIRSIRKSLAEIYAPSEKNVNFSYKSATAYGLGFGSAYGIISFFLAYISDVSSSGQWFFALSAFMYGIVDSIITEYFNMGFGLSHMMSLVLAAVFFICAYFVALYFGWIVV